jgi:hypothetical protein
MDNAFNLELPPDWSRSPERAPRRARQVDFFAAAAAASFWAFMRPRRRDA